MEVVPIAVDTVERVRTSEVWREAMAADERLVEVPFCITIAGETPPRLLTGVVDLLYRNSKGWHLIDYKTDRLPLASLCDLYGDQIRQYARHWAAISKEPLVYAGIYSTQLRMRSHDLHKN
jgi:ATP-dependent exoDNAse (exonuclease V) beta subunit